MKNEILKVTGITKHFGGVTAVNNVSFEINKGEIVAVIGPNGAGKTTLFNMISGVTVPNSGEIYFKGEKIKGIPVHQLTRKGIRRTFQNLEVFDNMTVLENVMLGAHTKLKTNVYIAAFLRSIVRRDDQLAMEAADQALALVGLSNRRNELAGNLSYGLQILLDVARAFVAEPELILLDEPMAGLNDAETDKLSSIILEMKNKGYSFLFVEHDVRTVMKIADRVVVIDFGNLIADGTPDNVQKDPKVIAAYLGEEVY